MTGYRFANDERRSPVLVMNMKRQYDFSKGERGKFYRPGLRLNIPVYLDAKLQKSVAKIARRKGQEVGAVVSQIVRKEVKLIEALK